MVTAEASYTLKPATALGARRKRSLQRSILLDFFPPLPNRASVLEIGPGRGEFAHECCLRNFDYLGIEPSEDLYKKLCEAGLKMISQTVPPIPVASASFNVVHSNDFVEHLESYREVMEFFSESYRVLKPNGYMSVIAPNYLTIQRLFFQYEYQHSYVTTKARLEHMLLDNGFELVAARTFLFWISPKWNWADRFLAHTLIPVSLNPLVQAVVRWLTSEGFLFRVHKNMFDHVAVLARKPSS